MVNHLEMAENKNVVFELNRNSNYLSGLKTHSSESLARHQFQGSASELLN